MNLFELLKQFKAIQPDAHYAEHSRRAVLASAQNPVAAPRKVFTIALHVFETAAAVVFAGFFILLITGSVSVAPVKFSVADQGVLNAEAQAVDMQIRLANLNYLNYPESSVPSVKTSRLNGGASVGSASHLGAAATSTPNSTSTPSSTLSVVDALEQLSQ